jgi:hypothetical protein
MVADAQPTEPVLSPLFQPGHHNPSGQITFSPPVDIDWEGLAPERITSIPNRDVPQGLFESLRRDALFHRATLSFDVSMDARVTAYYYYLIGPSGVVPLKVLNLQGEAVLSLARSAPTITRRLYTGVVVARPLGDAVGGGFVVWRLQPIPSEFQSQASRSLAEFSENAVFLDGLDEEARFKTVVAAYQFSLGPGEPTYVFQQWADDAGCFGLCCSSRYSISHVDSIEEYVAASLYDCDL